MSAIGLQDVTGVWSSFDTLSWSAQSLPAEPALVLPEARFTQVPLLVLNLRAWLQDQREDLRAVARSGGSRHLLYQALLRHELTRLLIAPRGSALAAGRPLVLRATEDAANVSEGWGLYRIRTSGDDTWYVGITSNLRRRLGEHRRAGRLSFEAGDMVEVLRARSEGASPLLWTDLQRAEREHIERLVRRGFTVKNITGGGNGMPPRRAYLARAEWAERADLSQWEQAPLRVEPRWSWVGRSDYYELCNLHTRWSSPEGEWDLRLTRAYELWAMAHGTGHFRPLSGRLRMSRERLTRMYANLHGRDLAADLDALGEPWRLQQTYSVRFWYPSLAETGAVGSERERIPSNALQGLSREDVVRRQLPRELEEQGFEIEPRVKGSGSLNHVMQVRGGEEVRLFVKTEENADAVRAEVVASLLWHRLGWVGLYGRTISLDNDQVLVSPALGACDVEDRGNFGQAFRYLPLEQPDHLRADRAAVLRRVTLDDLRLADPDDVLRFVALNGVLGNSDRHQDNVHYGWRSDPKHHMGGAGYLLPLDHGRCLRNNDVRCPGQMVGDPADAVLGRISNPNQLLRAFTQRTSTESATSVLFSWLGQVKEHADDLLTDPSWSRYDVELQLVSNRAGALASDLDAFMTRCRSAVSR